MTNAEIMKKLRTMTNEEAARSCEDLAERYPEARTTWLTLARTYRKLDVFDALAAESVVLKNSER